MSLFRSFLSKVGLQAATTLPPVGAPKVKNKPSGFPSYLTTTKPGESALPKADRRLASTDITSYRNGTSTAKVIRDFAAASPDLSAAVFAYLRVGITKGYTAVAKNPDGTFNPEATMLLQQVIARMDVLPNYLDGFSASPSLRSCSEQLAKEIVQYGSMSLELVLDKSRMPSRLQPISTTTIKFKPDSKTGLIKPVQEIGGQEIDLDVPTFFYVTLDQDLMEPYSASPLEPAIKAVLFSEDFVADLQRVAKRAVHPRLYVKLIEEKIKENVPAEAQHDPDKFNEYLNSVISSVRETIDGLAPEEALVLFDCVEPDMLNNGNISVGAEWETLQSIINAKLSTGAKTMPAILGHGVGSQNVASSESMLFVKNAAGAVKCKLDEIYSRVFTLAVRLFGHDVTVTFQYDDIDLRPESELEAFRSQKQSRLLELLSLGLITDEEACIQLTGKLPPAGYKPLMGTMFQSKAAGGNDNPNGESNGGSTLNQSLKSDAPTQTRGGNNKSNPVKAEVLPMGFGE